ncbi:MAG: hypothetical protein A2Y17_04915 [Clostridiales bacterium GWF2_38_85]|nr:MAG: hypothetical protein A2Y17_04915 [Clostridiales bacterium GWF2_38_85]HBL84371.1 hypothetical protein [Clostridiales bacterium]
MSEPIKKPNQIPESYSPTKPLIMSMVQKITELSPEIPAIEVYQAHREQYQVLGIENKTPNGTVGDWGACWNVFLNSNARNIVEFLRTEKSTFLGVFCQSDTGYYNYLIGGVVSDVSETPEGMFLANFPAADFIVVTHEWMPSIDEAEQQVGRIVGYAHGSELQLPDGYIKYNAPPSPIMFIESYNYEFDNNRFRFEVWFPIRDKGGEIK